MKLLALAGVFAAGIALAVGVAAHDAASETTTETTTETTSTTVQETTTAPGTTVVTTSTVAPTTATTSGNGSKSSTPTWVWIVLAVLAAAVVGLAAALLTRRPAGVPPADRRRRLDGAVATWIAQGWALESQTADTAVLRRGAEQMMVTVDDAGQITTRPLSGPQA